MPVVNLAETTYGFFIPSVTLMGVGASKEVGAKAAELGAKKCMIVTDAGLAKLGVAAKIQENIKAAGVDCIVYDGAEPNPTDKNVHDGVKVYQDNGCDFIVSLGGGSSHDCGKGIGLVTAGGGHIRDYEGVNKSTVPLTPLISINTTAGTASEMTRFCIITNTDTKVKMAIVDWRVTPLVAIDDPVRETRPHENQTVSGNRGPLRTTRTKANEPVPPANVGMSPCENGRPTVQQLADRPWRRRVHRHELAQPRRLVGRQLRESARR